MKDIKVLFTKSENEITFADIEDFCREFGEGVRVEYKREIKHIPKILSSFANTHGGVFVIGAETDEENKVKFPIQGISKKSGIEEQIQQSALTGIYPGVMPEIILVDVPNSSNLVIIIRVDESIHAPHAIKEVTQVYIRVGSITQPYEYKLAEMDRIAYMFKRREDSQAITRQILDRIEKRVEDFCKRGEPNLNTGEPNLTVIARPMFPYRPIISTEDIFELRRLRRRVAGGAYSLPEYKHSNYSELNEYGIVYQRTELRQETASNSENCLDFSDFLFRIGGQVSLARCFYEKCGYIGNIEFVVQLRQVFGRKLGHSTDELGWQIGPLECADSEISTSEQFPVQDLANSERLINIIEKLASEILWAFNTVKPKKIRELIEKALR